jgi:tetratricopeptide (TPR) repeat protein
MKARRPPWPSSTGSSPPRKRPATFRVLRAGLLFDMGQADEAIAALRALLDEEGIAPGTAGNARVALARMLLADGDVAGARALVEEAVELADAGQVDALKMLAAWLDRGRSRRCCDFAAAHRFRSRARGSRGPDPDGRGACPQRRTGNWRATSCPARWRRRMRRRPRRSATPALLLEDDRAFLAEELVIDALRRAPGHPELLSLSGPTSICRWKTGPGPSRWKPPCGTGIRVSLADQLRTGILAAQGQTEAALDLSRRACRCRATAAI